MSSSLRSQAVVTSGNRQVSMQLDAHLISIDTTSGLMTRGEDTRPLSLDEVREFQIRFVMHLCKGNKTIACRMLGINRRTLYRTLDRMSGKPRHSTREVIGADDGAPGASEEPLTAVQ